MENLEEKVNLVNPEGKVVTVPKEQAEEAVSQYGFKPPTPQQLSSALERKQYGKGFANELKAGALGAAGSFSMGIVPEVLAQSGLVPSEEQAALAKYNPAARMVGQGVGLAGSVALGALTGGTSEAAETAAAARLGLMDLVNPLAGAAKIGKIAGEAASPLTEGAANLIANSARSPIANQILATAGKMSVGSATEAALFGVGQAIEEHALGDPEALGEHLLPTIGMSAALGGTAGAFFGAAGGAYKGVKGKFQTAATKEAALRDAIAEQSTQPVLKPVPTDIEGIKEAIGQAEYAGLPPAELPGKATLDAASAMVPDMQYPITNLQKESLSSQTSRDYYKGIMETQSEDAQALRTYEALQKRELTAKLKSEIASIAPGKEVTSDAAKAGHGLVESFTKQYEAEKAELAPFFKQFDEGGLRALEHPGELIDIAEKSLPGISEHMKITPEGVELAPYKKTMPFSKNTYSAVKDMIEAANDEKTTFGGLRNMRENWRDEIDWLGAPKASAEISNLRANVMEYIVNKVPEGSFRDTAKRYAINEEKRAVIEKIFGGSISNKATFGKAIKAPEDILNHLFRNTGTVDAAKTILPKDVFNKAVADYLSHHVELATDATKMGFSSNKFASLLKRVDPELTTAIGDAGQAHGRIKAITDIMRILPDSAPINPSQTAKTLNIMEVVHKLGSLLHPVEAAKEAGGKLLHGFAERAEELRQKEMLNQILAGKSVAEAQKRVEDTIHKYSVLHKIEDTAKKVKNQIVSKSGSIFKDTSPVVPYMAARAGSKLVDRHEKHKDTRTAMLNLMNDPQKFMDTLHNASESLYAAAPNTAQSYQSAVARATSFLTSKLPQPTRQSVFASEFKPSPHELSKFERYQSTVDHPLSTLDHLKSATLTPEHLETLQAVYPKLYEHMQQEVMNSLMEHKGKKDFSLSYPKKMALSMFLQTDLDNALSQPEIMKNQLALMKKQSENADNKMMSAPSIRPTAGGMREITKSNRSLTAMQSIAAGGEA